MSMVCHTNTEVYKGCVEKLSATAPGMADKSVVRMVMLFCFLVVDWRVDNS